MPSPAVATPPTKVEPFLPFTRPTIDDATIAGVAEVLRSGWITSGPQVEGVRGEAVGVFRRPAGARLQLRHLHDGDRAPDRRNQGRGRGDHDPAHLVATSNVVLDVGATPVFVDIDPVTRLIDLDQVEAAITPRTRAIIPVDLSGLPVDRDRLAALAAKHHLRVIEDAAQSFGSTWRGKRIGSFGDFASFSFHANKNITTTEGGCLVLNDEREAKLAEQYRLQGVVRSGHDGMEVELVGGSTI